MAAECNRESSPGLDPTPNARTIDRLHEFPQMSHSSDLTPVNPESMGSPRGYSNGMLARPGGSLLFIAGQIAWDAEQKIVCKDFRGQFARALHNVVTVVREAGGHPENIAQLTIFVTNKKEYLECLRELGESYRLLLGKHFPTMALVEVSALVEPEAKVEIQGIAVVYTEDEAAAESTGSHTVSEFRPALSGRAT